MKSKEYFSPRLSRLSDNLKYDFDLSRKEIQTFRKVENNFLDDPFFRDERFLFWGHNPTRVISEIKVFRAEDKLEPKNLHPFRQK